MASHFLKILGVFSLLWELALPLSAQSSKGQSVWEEWQEWVVKEAFLSPTKREEAEIMKRVREVQIEEIASVRSYLHYLLFQTNKGKEFLQKPREKQELWEREWERIPRLGGVRIEQGEETLFQYGDWTDFYEDGLSRSKIRLSGQIPSFDSGNISVFFYLRNEPGIVPSYFSLVGWETRFYAFGDDGSLRFTNDPKVDPSVRLDFFQKAFDRIRVQIPLASHESLNDLHLFLVPGFARPLGYFFFVLRLFLYAMGAYLLWDLLRFLRKETI